MTVTRPVAVWIVPIAGGSGAAITWAQPTAPSSPGTSQVPRNTLPLLVLWGASRFALPFFQDMRTRHLSAYQTSGRTRYQIGSELLISISIQSPRRRGRAGSAEFQGRA